MKLILRNIFNSSIDKMQILKAFTLIELVIVLVILATLSTIGFISYTEYLTKARDSTRFTDIHTLKTNLKSAKQQVGAYSMPASYFTITNSGASEVYEGILDENIAINTINNIPTDPKNGQYYLFSVTKNKQEFQIAITLENDGRSIALLDGDYKTVSKNLFPSIMLAISGSGQQIEIHDGIGDGSTNRQKFIVNNGGYNLPYDFTSGNPVSNGSTVGFSGIITEAGVSLETNNEFSNCVEIYEEGKYLGYGEYQVLDSDGSITNTGCTINDSSSAGATVNQCTSWTYSTGVCQPDNTQALTVLTSSPSGCTGGTPASTGSCTYVPKTITLINTGTVNLGSITMPSGIQAGDLIIASCKVGNASTTIPPTLSLNSSGYTLISSMGGYNTAAADADGSYIFYKIATGSESGTTFSFTPSSGGTYLSITIHVFRLSGGISSMNIMSINAQGSVGTKITLDTQTITSGSGTAPLLVYAIATNASAINFTPSADQIIDTGRPSGYKIYNSSPANMTVSMTNGTSTEQILQSFYIQFQ